MQTESLSAFGCLARVSTSPTTTVRQLRRAGPNDLPSTSKPRNVIARQISSIEAVELNVIAKPVEGDFHVSEKI